MADLLLVPSVADPGDQFPPLPLHVLTVERARQFHGPTVTALVRVDAPSRPPPRVEHPAPASPPPEGRNVGWATCSTCGNRYAFDHAREPGRFVVKLGGPPVVICFPVCPQCGKRKTAEVTLAPDGH
jgi:hypothetical protein